MIPHGVATQVNEIQCDQSLLSVESGGNEDRLEGLADWPVRSVMQRKISVAAASCFSRMVVDVQAI